MKRLKRLWQFQKIETAKTICNIILKPVFDAESHGDLCFCSFGCFKVANMWMCISVPAQPCSRKRGTDCQDQHAAGNAPKHASWTTSSRKEVWGP